MGPQVATLRDARRTMARRRIQAAREAIRDYERGLQSFEQNLERDEEYVGTYTSTGFDEPQPRKTKTRREVVFEAIDRVPDSEYTKGGAPEFDAINEGLRKRGYEELENAEERNVYWRDYQEERQLD